MQVTTDYDLDALEHTLARAIHDVASELRWIDVIELIAFLRLDQHANIEALLVSSCEKRFRPGTLRYCRTGEAFVEWGEEPSIELSLSFQNLGITTFFRLLLKASCAEVEIDYVDVEYAHGQRGGEVEHLRTALDEARLMPPAEFLEAGMQPSGGSYCL